MDEREFQRQSIAYMRRGYWVALASFAVAVAALLLQLFTSEEPETLEGGQVSGSSGTGVETATSGTASTSFPPESAPESAQYNDDRETDEAASPEETDHPILCCSWYSIGSQGSEMEVLGFTVVKILAVTIPMGLVVVFRVRQHRDDPDSNTGLGLLFAAGVLSLALGVGAAITSRVTYSHDGDPDTWPILMALGSAFVGWGGAMASLVLTAPTELPNDKP